jgi:opacity protein-like surface antigen
MMRMKLTLTAFILIGMAALCGAAAYGQADSQSNGQTATAPAAPAPTVSHIQTDAAVSFFPTFTSVTSGNGTLQTPTNSVGGMLELRQILKPLLGYEMTYSFSPSDQAFAPKAGNCDYVCQNTPTKISASVSEIGFDYVASHTFGNLRPFAVGGLGFYITIPGATPYGNRTVIRAAYIFGGGLDWNMTPRLGLRLQYRDNLFTAANLSSIYPPTGVLTHSEEPMAGVYYRF